MWRDSDKIFNPIKSLLCALGLALFGALVLTGLVGAIWATVEMVRMVF